MRSYLSEGLTLAVLALPPTPLLFIRLLAPMLLRVAAGTPLSMRPLREWLFILVAAALPSVALTRFFLAAFVVNSTLSVFAMLIPASVVSASVAFSTMLIALTRSMVLGIVVKVFFPHLIAPGHTVESVSCTFSWALSRDRREAMGITKPLLWHLTW